MSHRNIADPGIENALECRIETAPEYKLGEPILVTGTLSNSGTKDAWILFRNTFLAPNWQDCVAITRQGASVQYTGDLVFHHAPGHDSYTRIPAGKSVSRQIALSAKYDITEPGDYEASFHMPVLGATDEGAGEPPGDEKALQLALVESAKLSFRVVGTALATPKVAHRFSASATGQLASAFPLQPTAPQYTGMNQDQQNAIRRAHFTAYNNILVALDTVQKSIDPNINRLYCDWFDQKFIWGRQGPWEQRWQTVIRNLSSMATLMSSATPITYHLNENDPNCPFDRLAYVYPARPYDIYACSKLFNDDFIRFAMWSSAEWGRAFAVVHEVSHVAGGTTDDWYSWSICQQLSTFNPNLAVTNAQNYALYVMMRAGGDLPMTSKYRVKCYDTKSNAFLGWLDSDGNWLSLTGTDPKKVDGTTVYWYEHGGERFITRAGSSRYVGDNGNSSQGNAQAAWNLWARATAAEWTDPTGQIFIHATPGQHLVKKSDGIYWSDSADGAMTFEFVEV
jgi:peptidyl-Lys metalloendopeptidase